MITSLDVGSVVDGLINVAHKWQSAKEQLNALDGATGDGDLGITMSRGSQAILEGITPSPADISRILFKAGMDFNDVAPSTMGALLATGFTAMAKEIRGQSNIDVSDINRMFVAAIDAICRRGGAKQGDKTMLDALVPAQLAIDESARKTTALLPAFEAALAAAEAGVRATVDMKPSFGRARWLGQRTVGHADAGATVVQLALEAIVEFLMTVDGLQA